MPEGSEDNGRRVEPKRPETKWTIFSAVGAGVLGLAGLGMLGAIVCGVLFGQFIIVAVCMGGVGLGWLLT